MRIDEVIAGACFVLLLALAAALRFGSSPRESAPDESVRPTVTAPSPASQDDDLGASLPDGYLCTVLDLNAPCIPLAAAMALDAYQIAACESSMNPLAVSATADYGLFQINRGFHERRAAALGYGWQDLFEVGPNTVVALSIWEERGWAAWSCKPGVNG